MATTSSDLLAFIVLKGSDALAAEAMTELTAGDTTTADFKPGKYFEAEDFSFGLRLDDDEPAQMNNPDDKMGMEANADRRSFARWRQVSPLASANGKDKIDPPFRSEIEALTLTRMVDSASPILVENCLNMKDFTKLVVVKRARTGSDSLSGFMRFEFTKVQIKSIKWNDGEAIRETCTFNFDGVTMRYFRRSIMGKAKQEISCVWERRK